MTQVARTIDFEADGAQRFGFVVLKKENAHYFDRTPEQLIVCEDGDKLVVRLANQESQEDTLGIVVADQDDEYTEAQKEQLCADHGIVKLAGKHNPGSMEQEKPQGVKYDHGIAGGSEPG